MAADTLCALEADAWALDKPRTVALRESAQSRLEMYIAQDAFSHPSYLGSSLFALELDS